MTKKVCRSRNHLGQHSFPFRGKTERSLSQFFLRLSRQFEFGGAGVLNLDRRCAVNICLAVATGHFALNFELVLRQNTVLDPKFHRTFWIGYFRRVLAFASALATLL